MIDITDFGDFFEAIHGPGNRPFSWQEELLSQLVDTGRWPEQIVAPTGAGKSSVVEVHIFAVALFAVGAAQRVPRRLAVVVNRRALTDSHAERAERIQRFLAEAPSDGGILGRVREALISLRVSDAQDRSALVVTTMRGAAATDRAWLNAPEACAVLCMTPAMWASSLLFRSYGASRFARPRLAGMLALDAAVVVDEAHLSRQILVTARRVGELCVRSSEQIGVPALQAVEMTATPSDSAKRIVGVTRESLAQDSRLAVRVQAAKTIDYVPTAAWPSNGKMTAAYRDEVVAQVAAAVEDARKLVSEGARTVGCVLNRVDSALRVTEALKGRGLTCQVWVGRMRPWDLERLRRQHPDLFGPAGSEGIDVLVATQTVEVGVDLDLVAMVTELAPASAIAQRAGRVNRMGRRKHGKVVVVGPVQVVSSSKDMAPYRGDDLAAGFEWVQKRAADGDLSPLMVSENPPPAESPRRLLFQRPEPWDAILWAKTSMDLLVEPELDLWIRDDLDPEVGTLGVVLRDLIELPDATACETLVTAVPPQDREVYPVTMTTARKIIKRLGDAPERSLEKSVLWRDGGGVASWQKTITEGTDASDVLKPGDLLILDASTPLLSVNVVTEKGREQGRPVPYEELDGLTAIITDPDQVRRLAILESDEISRLFPNEVLEWPAGWDPDEGPAWVVRRSAANPEDESDERSAWSVSGKVMLADHNAAVADRAGKLAKGIGMKPILVGALEKTGTWHDVGKGDTRFQRLLWRGNPDSRELLAKSGGRSMPPQSVRRAWANAGLPPGWRHELVSAAAYWERTAQDETDSEMRDLITRMIGTSHGRGRPLFAHGPATAGPDHAEALEDLLGEGEWESIVARTDRKWGPWGTAYLETVLRAADCTISAGGK